MPVRITDSRKNVRGTLRPSRTFSTATPTRLTKTPPPPPTMSDRGVSEWARLAPQLVSGGTLTAADLRALELLCECLATADELATIVRKDGAAVPTSGGGVKGHPALSALAQARAQAAALLAQFGLTPRSRAGVEQAPEPVDPRKPLTGLASFR